MTFRALGRVLCWNVMLTVAGLGFLALAGEAWLRTIASLEPEIQPWIFVPGLGAHFAPNAASRVSSVDFQRDSRTNSAGFLDREPLSREAALATCHVAVVGDSFVMARSMALADKLHVQMERMADRRLPHLDVTTAAYGIVGSGQVHQLAFWDKWIRRRPPRLVVLVAVGTTWPRTARAGTSGIVSAWCRKTTDAWFRSLRFWTARRPPPPCSRSGAAFRRPSGLGAPTGLRKS